jgi:Flp pilus assembly protein TadD
MPGNDLTLIRLLAYMSVRHRAFDKAQALYEALLALDGEDRDAARGLAWARLEAGQPREALKALDEMAGPGDPDAVVHLLRARAFARLGRPEDAGVAMRAFLASRPAPAPEARP